MDPIIDALREFTTCDVSDALCILGSTDGGFLPGLTMWSPGRQDIMTKIVGPAYTVKYVDQHSPEPKHPTHYIDSIPKGSVIFISCPPITSNAVYGGLMSTRARAAGAVGTIVDGRFRDVQEQRDLNYPVFARDVGTAPPYGAVKVSAVNVPVQLHTTEVDATVSPGDYLIADANGVVLLPKDLVEEAISLMQKQVAVDASMAAALKQGMSFTEASKKFRA
ncbi:aldolase/RraA domain-containing protein [Sarocladium implicatum]|nr:aldolase/RraA domain-containing protein [Sarocladium implicatum]